MTKSWPVKLAFMKSKFNLNKGVRVAGWGKDKDWFREMFSFINLNESID